jgi:LacI family transcriptional regulator
LGFSPAGLTWLVQSAFILKGIVHMSWSVKKGERPGTRRVPWGYAEVNAAAPHRKRFLLTGTKKPDHNVTGNIKMADSAKKKVNIGEVAQAAGVSKMTVSRMLNHVCKVAPATRIRVQRIIDELQYRPNPMARGLATNKSRIIGLMMFTDVDAFYIHQILLGVEKAARILDYDLLVFSNPEEGKSLGDRIGLVDGVLCFGNPYGNDVLEKLDRDGVPFVVTGRRNWRRISPWQVIPDYRTGFRNAVLYLADLGHREIAMMGGTRGFEPDEDKYSGFRQGLAERGVPYNPGSTAYENESEKIKGLIEKYRPTAIIAESMGIQLALFLAVKELGFRVPGDLSIISTGREHDVHTTYSLTGIHELTSVIMPWQELGKLGLETLIQLITGGKDVPKERIVPLAFIEGESCAPPCRGEGGRKQMEVLCDKK